MTKYISAAITLGLSMCMPALASASNASCTIVANPGIVFTYNPLFQSGTASSSSIQISCTGIPSSPQPYTIAASAGRGTFAARKMKNAAGNLLQYNLYTNVSHTTVWGDGSGVTRLLSGSYSRGLPNPTSTYYGLITPAAQDIPAGNYTETLTVTVNF